MKSFPCGKTVVWSGVVSNSSVLKAGNVWHLLLFWDHVLTREQTGRRDLSLWSSFTYNITLATCLFKCYPNTTCLFNTPQCLSWLQRSQPRCFSPVIMQAPILDQVISGSQLHINVVSIANNKIVLGLAGSSLSDSKQSRVSFLWKHFSFHVSKAEAWLIHFTSLPYSYIQRVLIRGELEAICSTAACILCFRSSSTHAKPVYYYNYPWCIIHRRP